MGYSPVRNGRNTACSLRLKQTNVADKEWLRQVLPAAGLVENRDWTETRNSGFHISKPSWVRMFNTEYWRHYKNGAASTNRDQDDFTPAKITLIISFYIASSQHRQSGATRRSPHAQTP